MTREALERARGLVAGAREVVVLTGAGISAESGVPTFRGSDGLWKSYRVEELATPEAFRRDPRLVWEWYAWRRGVVAACAPNAGHRALARACLARPGSFTLVTQNVDGLHHRAALDEAGRERDPAPALPLELHGRVLADRCHDCGRKAEAVAVDTSSAEGLPRCAACGGPMRPDVVWFGEPLDAAVLGTAFERAGAADVCLVVGTSALVHPAASVPLATLRAGGVLIEVNPERTPLSPQAALTLTGPAAEVLPALLS